MGAGALLQDVTTAGVIPREDLDAELCQDAGDLRATFDIPTGDCFCVALARRLGSTVLTTDRNDFAPLVKARFCKVQFIR